MVGAAAKQWFAGGQLIQRLQRVGGVRPGEWPSVLLLSLNALLMLTAYYLLKTAREPLILVGGAVGISGPELKTYVSAVQAVLLIGVVPLYARIAGRVSRLQLIHVTGLAIVGSLLLFNLLGNLGVSIGLGYYVWLGIASLIGVAQFWSFANDFYSQEQGERLFPLIAAGGSIGAIIGARLANVLLDRIGALELLLAAAMLLGIYVVMYDFIERLPKPTRVGPRRTTESRATGPLGAFRLIRRSPYLLLIGCALLAANLVNTQGEYILSRTVKAHAERLVPDLPATRDGAVQPSDAHGPADAGQAAKEKKGEKDQKDQKGEIAQARQKIVGKFYGNFYSAVNLAALLAQLLIVGRIIRFRGVPVALMLFPLLVMGSYGAIAIAPFFAVIGAAKIAENSLDYSLHNTSRQALFLPTDRDTKYKAKVAVDSFFFRVGDLLAAATVFVGIHVLQLTVRGFATVNLVIAGLWLVIVAAIGRHYRRLTRDAGLGETTTAGVAQGRLARTVERKL